MLKFLVYNSENAQLPMVQKCVKEYAEQQYASIKVFSADTIEELVKL